MLNIYVCLVCFPSIVMLKMQREPLMLNIYVCLVCFPSIVMLKMVGVLSSSQLL